MSEAAHSWSYDRVRALLFQTGSSGDGVAHVTLVGGVQCRQELVEIVVRLAAQRRQQQLVLAIRRRFHADLVFLSATQHLPDQLTE